MKICIVKLSAMGDIIHAMISLQFIKKKYPDCQIDWIVESGFKGILEGNKHIDNILPIDLKKIKTRKLEIFNQIKILKKYSKNNYDIVIDAQGLLKSAIVSRIVGNKIVGSYIAGFDKNSIRESISSYFYDKTTSISYSANVIKRNLQVICEPLDIFVNDNKVIYKKNFIYSKSDVCFDDKYIVFVVGASKINKIYSKENFLKLSLMLKEKIIVVWGNNDEYESAKFLQNNNKNIHVAPKGNLNDLKSLISNSILVIGGDTGPTHIAWGANIPSICIFGNTPHLRNTYITDINRVVKSNSNVDALSLDKNDFSINEISAQTIVDEIKMIKDINV